MGSALIIAIGPQNALVLRQGLVRQHVFAVCTVCFLADALLIALGAGGLGTAFRADPLILKTVAWAGTAFLLFFAFQAFSRAAHPQALTVEAGTAKSLGAVISTTLAVTFLNPHVYLDTVLLLGGVAARFDGVERHVCQWRGLGLTVVVLRAGLRGSPLVALCFPPADLAGD